MAGSVSYFTTVDRSNLIFDLDIQYYVPGYSDPETGEYFGDTSWVAAFTYPDGTQGGVGGFDGEFGSAYLQLGLSEDGAVHPYRVDFTAMNIFSAESVAQSWNIIEAASATTALRLTGDAGIDLIVGGVAGDVLRGLAGDDLLDGGDGDDRLIGGAGADRLAGGVGANVLIGGAGDDTYTIVSALDEVTEAEGGGYDRIVSEIDYALGDQVESLQLIGTAQIGTGNATDNYILGSSVANLLSGLDGNDDLRGGLGDDIVRGGDGDDRLEGGLGADTLEGGAGDDAYYVDSALDFTLEDVDSGTDTVYLSGPDGYDLTYGIENLVRVDAFALIATGNPLDNQITGGAANDLIDGARGNDTLIGGLGDDVLTGGHGADRLDGGAGFDRASYASATNAVRIDLVTGLAGGPAARGDIFIGIEGLIGGAGDDRLLGNGAANSLEGGAGDDRLGGGSGNDTLYGGSGADFLNGGLNRDTASYAGSLASVSIDLALGVASGGDADGDTLISIESVTGGAGDDMLTGDAFANRLNGGGGGDTIDGGDGDDIVKGAVGADVLAGGAGFDRLSFAGSRVGVSVSLGAGTASGGDAEGDGFTSFEGLIGSALDDTLIGDVGGNRINGGDGDDRLIGGGGDDVIRGGSGIDRLSGGAGVDTLSFADVGRTQGVYASLGAGNSTDGDVIAGFENLIGTRFGDALYGDDGANALSGGGGSDVLNGYGGDDRLTGGDFADIFSFGDVGVDVVLDFDVTSGDALELYFGAAFDTFAEVLAAATATGPDGRDTTIRFFDDTIVILRGVELATLTADDFIFA